LGACGDATPGYLLHLTQGQMRVLLGSQPIDQILPTTTDTLHLRRFAWVDTVRAYASTIGLQGAQTNYTRFFDTGSTPISYNVSASPRTRLEPYEWDFPFVGPLPYKGFFTRDLALAEAEALRAEGFDAIARPVAAYSTLGYLPDPLLSTMLADDEARLADLLLHELTHATIFAEGQIDYNESTATFVGRKGALRLMQRRYGDESPRVRSIGERHHEALQFNQFMAVFLDELDSLYALNLDVDRLLPLRQVLLHTAQDRYRADPLFGSRYDDFLQWERVNNARLLSYRRYHRDLHLFDQVYSAQGQDLGACVEVFTQCAQDPLPFACLEAAGQGAAHSQGPATSQ
jgi:predicted aminopeptidase